MELAKTIAERGLLITSLDKEVKIWCGSKNERYSIVTRSVAGEELKNARMLENLSAEKRQAVLEMADHAEEIWKDLSSHLPYLQLLDREAIGNYVKAVEQAVKDGTIKTWFSFDKHRLADALGRSKADIRQVVMMMPYFEGNYFLHSLTNGRWKEWYRQGLPEKLQKEADGSELLKVAGSRDLRCHKFLRRFSGQDMGNFLRMYMKYPSGLEVLDRVDEMSSELFHIMKRTKFKVLEEIADYPWMISAIKSVQERYDSDSAAQLLKYLILEIPRAAKGILMQFIRVIQDKQKADIFLALEPCMKTAFLKNRGELLAVSEKEWFQNYIRKHNVETPSLITMALLDGRKHFLDLLMEDDWDHILLKLEEDMEGKPVRWLNLNQFNRKELEKIVKDSFINKKVKELAELLEKPSLTFQELEILSKVKELGKQQIPDMMKVFIAMLSGLRSEQACIRFDQYLRAVPQEWSFRNESEMEEVAGNLIQRDLPAWKNRMFRFEATLQTAAVCLPFAKHKIFLEASNDCEARFIAENITECLDYGFENVMESIMKTNQIIQRLKDILNLEETFYEEYSKEVRNFFLNGGADLAVTYFDSTAEKGERREMFKWIVKAALCGKLKKLRFRDNDLEVECGIPLSRTLQEIWIADEEMKWDGNRRLICGEDSTFHGIMEMGVKPYPTCMSYKDGQYRECLMAYFDGNKKVVYIKSDKKVLAKAVIRLTKMCTGGEMEEYPEFRDIEKETAKVSEQPVLFLENLYTGFQEEKQMELQRLMITFAENKAKNMDLPLVLAKDYGNYEGYHKERIGIYITKSKAGRQYLDSFGGDKINGGDNKYLYGRFSVKIAGQTGAAA